jgi:phosphate transport system substrate-binding protein
MKFTKKILTGVLGIALLAGCSSTAASTKGSASATAEATEKAETSSLTGTINAAGSSALLPLVQEAAEEFMDKNPDVVVNTNGGGSGEGLKQVSDGAIDIGNSDVFAEEKLDADAAKELVDHQVATVTMAAIVNKDLEVDNLTSDQLVSIFTGKTTNWSEVGGPDLEIMLVTRPSSSGTRATFKSYALNGQEEASNSALETDDSGTLVQTVTDNKGAIGYVALSYLTDNAGVKGVSIDDVEPTLENTYNGTYKVWSYEHMYTKGEPNEVTKAFLDFISGDEFASNTEKMGYGVASKLSDEAKATHK